MTEAGLIAKAHVEWLIKLLKILGLIKEGKILLSEPMLEYLLAEEFSHGFKHGQEALLWTGPG